MNNKATDEELAELFSMDSVEELISTAAGKREMLFHNTHDGQWIKYEGSTEWTFNRDPEVDDPE